MKKISLFLMGCVLSVSLFSQKSVQLGIKGGLNYSSINDEERVPDAEVNPRLGFNAGLLAHIHLSPNWAVQPEVYYSKEGAEYKFPSYTGKTDLNYINVPVLLQYMTGPGFRIQTGPQVGFLTSAKYEDLNNNESIKTDISKTNVSWSFGLGYLSPMGLGVDARFNLGLSSLYKEGIYAEDVNAKSRVGQLSLFYQFRH